MPTLIRLVIVLLFLAGLVYGGMVVLVSTVEPTQKEMRVRIPTRDLLAEPERETGGGGLPDLAPNVGGGQ